MAPQGGAWGNLVSCSDGGKLSVLSGAQRLPHYSFSQADRFRSAKKRPPLHTKHSLSSPSLTSASTAAPPTPAVPADDLSHCGDEDGDRSPASLGSGGLEKSSSAFAFTCPDMTFGLGVADAGLGYFRGGSSAARPGGHDWVVGSAPRLGGSLDRFMEHPARASRPKPKQYDPVVTLGSETTPAYRHEPVYSFGGGTSRMADMEPRAKSLRNLAAEAAKATAASARESSAPLAKARKPGGRQLARGFGTQPRLPVKGGPLQLAFSPGPAAYEVPRDADPDPLWSSSSVAPWGKRTGTRPNMGRKLDCKAGPGDHVAEYGFNHPAKPTPLFGHPLRKPTPQNAHWPEPGRYEVPTSVGVAPAYSIGSGPRGKGGKVVEGPAPGTYDVEGHLGDGGYAFSFSKTERVHESDLVDPDEPPGPGAHEMQRCPLPKEIVNIGSFKMTDERGKKIPGMGPEGPGPGHYRPTKEKHPTPLVAFPLPRKPEDLPGPGQYDHEAAIRLTEETLPSWRLDTTAKRKPPWLTGTSASDAMSMALATDSNQPSKTAFRPGGPRYSMPPRRHVEIDRSGMSHTMYAPRSSIG